MEKEPKSMAKRSIRCSEVAKALAFDVVITQMEEHMQKSCWELFGKSKGDFTDKHVLIVGRRHQTGRAVQKHRTKAKNDGKEESTNQRGRPFSISQSQKQAIVIKAMEFKEDRVPPTPEKIRILLPKKTINKATKESISDWSIPWTIRQIFKTTCYDAKEDDPWQFLFSLQQGCLTDGMKPPRVKTASHVLNHIIENAAYNFVAIGPCISLLPKKQDKADLLKHPGATRNG